MLFCLLYSFIVDGIKIISPTIPDSVLIMMPIFVLKKYLLYLNIVLLFYFKQLLRNHFIPQ